MAWIAKNSPTTLSEMKNNAREFWNFWLRQYDIDATREAVAAMLGNMQAESGINPGAWQGYTVNYNRGFGLVQWTPATNYTRWATQRGYPIDSGQAQCERIRYELDNGLQYYSTSQYPISFMDFLTKEGYTPEYLASAFVHNYERPASYSGEGQRRANARWWYTWMTGGGAGPWPPPPDPNPDPPYTPGAVLPSGKILGVKPIWKMIGDD